MAVYTTIDDPEAHFQIKTYTGNNDVNALTFDGTTDMQPDLVWIKRRNAAGDPHLLYDAIRGVNKVLEPNTDSAEATLTSLTAFGSDGFTLAADTSGKFNSDGDTFVAWGWKANGSGSSNTSGTINTAATSVNTTAGFSMMKYDGNSTSGATIGHGLGAKPTMIIVKSTDASAEGWMVQHSSYGATKYTKMNETGNATSHSGIWNDTEPTSTLISLGNNDATNTGNTYMSYAWTDIKGFSKFGAYTGNGDNDGPFVWTGFRPGLVWIKTVSNSWMMMDSKRPGYNLTNLRLETDGTGAENSSENWLDINSNGFKIRTSNGQPNTDGGAYFYMAWAQAPFVNSEGVPSTAR